MHGFGGARVGGGYASTARVGGGYGATAGGYSSHGYGGVGSPHTATGHGLVAPSPVSGAYAYDRSVGYGPGTRTGYGRAYVQPQTRGYRTYGYAERRVTPLRTGSGYGRSERGYGRGIGYGAADFGLGYGLGSYGGAYGYDGSDEGNYGYGSGSYGSAGYGQAYGGASYVDPNGYDPSTYSPSSAYGIDYSAPSGGFGTSTAYQPTYGTGYNCTCGQ